MKVGENPKMLYPPCGRSIKTYGRGTNDAPSVTKYGSPIRLDTQIVALRPHCARTAPRAPPWPMVGLALGPTREEFPVVASTMALWHRRWSIEVEGQAFVPRQDGSISSLADLRLHLRLGIASREETRQC